MVTSMSAGSTTIFLHPEVRGMIEKLGIGKLTEAPEKLIPHVLAGENALLVSPTGTGIITCSALCLNHCLPELYTFPFKFSAVQSRKITGQPLKDSIQRLSGFMAMNQRKFQFPPYPVSEPDRQHIIASLRM